MLYEHSRALDAAPSSPGTTNLSVGSRDCWHGRPAKHERGNAVCFVEGCDRTVQARGLCPTHYERLRKGDDRVEVKERQPRGKTCSANGCSGKVVARGLCTRHYWQEETGPRCSVDGCEKGATARGLCNTHYARLRTRGDLATDVAIGDLGPRGRKGHGRRPDTIARSLVAQALDTGRLMRPEHCERCGRATKRLEAHRRDYRQPLEVEWLCISCHRRYHVIWLPTDVAARLDHIATICGVDRDEIVLSILQKELDFDG